jgi:hypothetical protein
MPMLLSLQQKTTLALLNGILSGMAAAAARVLPLAEITAYMLWLILTPLPRLFGVLPSEWLIVSVVGVIATPMLVWLLRDGFASTGTRWAVAGVLYAGAVILGTTVLAHIWMAAYYVAAVSPELGTGPASTALFALAAVVFGPLLQGPIAVVMCLPIAIVGGSAVGLLNGALLRRWWKRNDSLIPSGDAY